MIEIDLPLLPQLTNRFLRSCLPEKRDVVSIIANQAMTAGPVTDSFEITRLLRGTTIESPDSVGPFDHWVCHPIFSIKARNAFVHGDSGVLYLDDVGKYVLETSWGWGKYRTASTPKYRKREMLHIKTSRPLYVASGHGYHGIVEDLSAILFLMQEGEVFDLAVREDNAWLKETLRLFLGERVNLYTYPAKAWVTSNELISTTKSSFGEFVHPYLVRCLNLASKSLKLKEYPRTKIFISRSDTNRRKSHNDHILESISADLGFEKFRLRDLSVEEQVALFRNASHITGLHGAGFVNISWCMAPAKVLEFYHRVHFNGCYSSMSRNLGLSYRCYDLGWKPEEKANYRGLRDNMEQWFSFE